MIVKCWRRLVGIEQEYVGQWCYVQFVYFVMQVNFGLDIYYGVVFWYDDKVISVGCLWGVQQCIDSQMFVGGFRMFDLEFVKMWEFFVGWQCGIDSQVVCGQVVNLILIQYVEVVGIEYVDDFIVFIFVIDWIQYFEVGEIEVFYCVFIVLNVIKVKIVWVIFNFVYVGGCYFIDGDWCVEVYILMVKFKFEWGFLVILVSFIVIKLNLLVICVFYVVESGGQVIFWCFIVFFG